MEGQIPLTDIGVSPQPTATGENVKMHDDDGRAVIVAAMQEVIQDYGWPKIIEVAPNKFDAIEVWLACLHY